MTLRIGLRLLALAGTFFILAAATVVADTAPDRPTLVVYASNAHEDGLARLLESFTDDTGIAVSIVFGDSAQQADRLLAGTDVPNADVILADRLQPLWRAAEDGALRPYASDAVDARLEQVLRDPDGFWAGVGFLEARVLVDTRTIDKLAVEGFEYLADDAVAGKLCLTRSALPVNRAVIAQLIKKHGRRPAEIIVRGWIRNLARPPFDSESELVAALAAGECGIGIVSSAAGRPVVPGFLKQPLSSITPLPRTGNVDAVGISRHAEQPDAARQLVEWLFTNRAQADYAAMRGLMQVIDVGSVGYLSLSTVGFGDEEAAKLAERARYR